ncbi:GH25 family lysozyme [Enorma shizhengliae]|nr:GH25 family lysozyme [Enorma shizhengliae]
MSTPPSGASAQGVDVSTWNGTIDWAKVKAAGIDFAVLRVGYGDSALDKQFVNNVRGCKANGVPFGVYVYSYAWDAASSKLEGQGTVTRLQQAGVSPSDLSLPVYYDLENENPSTHRPAGVDDNNNYREIQGGAQTFADMASSFASVLESNGYTVGVYANLNWWRNYLTSSTFNKWDRWVAQYNSTCTYTGSYSMWQYTSTGSVSGISGNVDLNWWYGVPDCSSVTLSAQANGNALSLSTSGFTTAPKNVAFAVTSSTGTTKWYQAYQRSDGSWTANPSVVKDFSSYGTYTVSVWATFGFTTISVTSTSASLSAGDVEASAAVSGESLELSVSGWSAEPSNASFEVVAPSGASRWYQAERQEDGSWTAEVPAFSDMGEVGSYSARAWATLGGFTSVTATASAEFSAGDISASASIEDGSIALSASGWALQAKNVSFEVRSPSGASRWYQAYRQSDGSWAAAADAGADFGEWGEYTATVFATYGRSTASYGSARVTAEEAEPSVEASASGASFELAASGWTLSPKNVAFEVVAPSGSSRWYQAYRQSDGSWTASISALKDFGAWGEYSVKVWATYGSSTRVMANGSASLSAGDVEASAAVSGESLELSVSGWSAEPSNASFEVVAPSGASRWYQAERQEDGSWTAEVPAFSDMGEVGSYSARAWATLGGFTSVTATASAEFSAGDISASASIEDGSIALSASGWALQAKNVSFEVRSPSGASRWYQAYRQSDGSWAAAADAGADFGEWGEYTATVFATYGRSTASYGSARVTAEEAEPSVEASASGASFELAASGWTLSPKNVAFEVVAPSGSSRWYQAERQADGSWAANVRAGADFGEWGTYNVRTWATYAGSTKLYASASTALDRVSIRYSVRKGGGGWVAASDGAQASTWNGSIVCGANALSVSIVDSPVAGSVQFQGYAAGNGWTDQKVDGGDAGPFSESAIFSGIKVSFTGDLQNYADIWYRVYVNDFGWLGWAKNGALAGTTNLSLQVQSVEMIALPKGSKAPGSTINASLTTYPYIGFQNPAGYYQVSNKSVAIPHQGEGIFGYRSESTISYKATKQECINAMITRSMDYLGTPYRWDYSCAPGVGVDCAGLVMQALYATGMDLSPMNPWDHYYLGLSGGWHSAYANYMWNNGKFQKLSFSQRQRGDIVSWPGHVAIYLGNDQIIEAANGDVHITNVYRNGTPRGVLRPFIG